MHGFEDGDTVTFREICGMNALNEKQCKIQGNYFIFHFVNFNKLGEI